MHWYLPQDAFHRTFTLGSKSLVWNSRRQLSSKALSIRQIFIFHKTFDLENELHHDKAETLSFLAKSFMHWYLAQYAFHRPFYFV